MKSIMLGVGVLLLASCAAEPPIVVPMASPVNVMDATTPQSVISHDNCLLKGHVLARTWDQGNPNNLLITQEELRVIKEKAAVLGANSIVIRANQVVYDNGRYVHVINADAYACLIP
ncbi:MAG TPA: hypothetical protein VGV92_00790 [Gammaproteobacteria bacterium]|nr:hypothetical protein [Gammaproteobacteria bacterium]